MTLNISISEETETKLREKAVAVGKDVVQYARELIEQGVTAPNGTLSRAEIENRLLAIHRLIDSVSQQHGRYPPGYVADDSRESIY